MLLVYAVWSSDLSIKVDSTELEKSQHCEKPQVNIQCLIMGDGVMYGIPGTAVRILVGVT